MKYTNDFSKINLSRRLIFNIFLQKSLLYKKLINPFHYSVKSLKFNSYLTIFIFTFLLQTIRRFGLFNEDFNNEKCRRKLCINRYMNQNCHRKKPKSWNKCCLVSFFGKDGIQKDFIPKETL